MYSAKVVTNQTEAASAATAFLQDGFTKENIYVFAHDKKESKQLTETTETGEVGFQELGLAHSLSTLFKGRSETLLAKLQGLGMDEQEAADYEEQLTRGLFLVVAAKETADDTK